jgi:hypothetical protein
VCSLIVSSFQEILNPILYRLCRQWKMELRKLPLLPEVHPQVPATQGAGLFGPAFIARIRTKPFAPFRDPIPCVVLCSADPDPYVL